MTIVPPPLPPITFGVYRRTMGVWRLISRAFPTEAQAGAYLITLPGDWQLEVREIPHQPEAA